MRGALVKPAHAAVGDPYPLLAVGVDHRGRQTLEGEPVVDGRAGAGVLVRADRHLALERMSLSVPSYLKLTSLSVITGLRKVRMPSGLPGSGKRMGSTCVV